MPLPNTRQELSRNLEAVMSHAYAQLEERQRLEADTSLVKTYLVEAHKLRAAQHDRTLQTIRANFVNEVIGGRVEPRVHETEEEMFFNVTFGRREDQSALHIDATNPRFWLIHTTAKTNDVDPIIQKLVSNTNQFDRVWLPIQLLTRIAGYGSLRGLGLDYDRRSVPDVDFEADNAPMQFLKMQLWGNRARDVLRILKGPGAFADSTTLSKVKIKYYLERQQEAAFCIADMKYDGKITGRGTSFRSYITLVTLLYRDYITRIEDYERRFTVKSESDQGRFNINGEPLNIRFTRPLPNIEEFCARVFSGSQPFRLMGLPIKTGQNSFRVNSIDLHVGRRMSFEVSPEYMRVYLAPGGCGNSLARLYTNLQHHYNSQVEAVDGSEAPAFAEQYAAVQP